VFLGKAVPIQLFRHFSSRMNCLVTIRELHGDGDDGITAVSGNGVRLYDGHRGNSGDGDSVHGSTTVAVTAPMVNALFMHELK